MSWSRPLKPLLDASVRVAQEVPKWKRPDQSWLKLNCDGALNTQENVVGAGVVVSDHAGVFVLAECRSTSTLVIQKWLRSLPIVMQFGWQE
jgi:hypothetical protein